MNEQNSRETSKVDEGKPRFSLSRRQALVATGAAGVGLTFLLAGDAFAAPSTSTTTAATTATTSTRTAPSAAASRTERPEGSPFGPGKGRHGGPGGGMTVSAISGNTITVKRPDGSTQTITVSGTTTYSVAGTAGQFSDIKTGAQIHAVGTMSNGTLVVSQIDVQLPHIGGKLTAIAGTTLSVTNAAGTAKQVIVGAGTRYLRAATAIGLGDLQIGNQVDVVGDLNSNGSLAARVIRVILPAVDGVVTAVSGNTITVNGRGPSAGSKTVTVNAATTYTLGAPASTTAANLGAIQVGGHIHAEGALSSSGALLAATVHINLPAIAGVVTGVSGTTITVRERGPQSAATRAVNVSEATVYVLGEAASATKGSLSDVKSGDHIHAEGSLGANGSLNATTVRIDQPPSGASR